MQDQQLRDKIVSLGAIHKPTSEDFSDSQTPPSPDDHFDRLPPAFHSVPEGKTLAFIVAIHLLRHLDSYLMVYIGLTSPKQLFKN